MRYVNIFLLHFQQSFAYRGRSFIWFLLAFYNPLLVLVFWIGAFAQEGFSLASWSFSSITSYYFLLIIAASFLVVHIEEDVAVEDIREGGLVKYLIRPFSYYWLKFFEEFGYRLTQGAFGVVVFLVFFLVFRNLVTLTDSIMIGLLSVCVITFGYFISFTFKMIVGLSAFWFTDFWGLQQLVEVIMLLMGGFLMPLDLFPQFVQNLANILPFSYMVYFPIVAIQGKLSFLQLLHVIAIQGMWLAGLLMIYKMLWREGIRKFTAVGQ